MELKGEIVEANRLSSQNIKDMYALMDEFYDNMTFPAFTKDLGEKDYCILLFNGTGEIKGFTTQKIISVNTGKEEVFGIFSGDTIIHKDYWGSLEIHKVFARFLFEYKLKREDLYWFLISKGYKTYKFLPTFFKTFYPNYKEPTPDYERSIMDAFGLQKYPSEYDIKSGVICYKTTKDTLKAGVADVTKRQLEDKNMAFFLRANPDYFRGNDLVCLTKLSKDNFKPAALKLLLRK